MFFEKVKSTAGLLGAGSLGIVGALSILGTPAHAQGLAEVTTGLPATGELGGAALIGVLVYLLQASTRERVNEAKEYSQMIREQAAGHAQQLQQERSEVFAQMENLRQSTNEGQMRLLQFYERLAAPELHPQPRR